jgi:hypothetical protein
VIAAEVGVGRGPARPSSTEPEITRCSPRREFARDQFIERRAEPRAQQPRLQHAGPASAITRSTSSRPVRSRCPIAITSW